MHLKPFNPDLFSKMTPQSFNTKLVELLTVAGKKIEILFYRYPPASIFQLCHGCPGFIHLF